MPSQNNITNIPSNRVDFIDQRTGLMSREWYRFFLNLFNLTGAGNNPTSLDDLQVGPPTTGGGETAFGTVTSVQVSGGSTGLTTSGGPITSAGTITIGGTLGVANGGTGATTAGGAPFALKGANADITSMSALTGAVGSPTSIQMGNGSTTTLAAGKMWYDQTTGSWNMGMGGGNITQQVGEELFIYGKASAAITEGQLICKTGTVGASGVITFGPSPTGLTVNDGIIGIATENIALNAFGRITSFGVVHGINTTGSSVGETWADNDTLYYNPNYVGGLTKVKPSAPYIKFEIGTVINAGSGGSGSIQVELIHGSTLGGTDSNVQFGTLANNNLIAYDSGLGYWKNVTSSSLGLGTVTSVAATAGTGISVTGSPITTSGTLNITNTAPDQVVSLTGAGTTSVTGTYPNFTITSSDAYSGTVTSVATSGTVSGLTLTGGPITTTGTITLGGTLAVTPSNFSSQTANTFLAAPNGLAGTPTFRAIVAADVPTLNQNTTGTASNVTGTVAIANGGTGQTTASAGFNALSPVTTTGDLIIGNGTNSSTRLPIGANSYVLTSNGTTATWAASTGGVTSFSAGTTGFTPSTGTTGAVTLAGTLNVANGGTGLTSLTANYIPYGNGTSAFSSSANFAYNGTYLRVGATTPLAGATNPITAFTGSTNGYVQTYILNGNSGTSASADLVAYADNSTDAHGWADMGFTSSTYADATYTVTGKNEAYLFGSAPTGAGATGNMVYATDSTGSANAHQFYVGGFTQAKSAWKAQIDSTGLKATQVNATNGFIVNSMTVSANYTIATGDSAMSVGPMTIASGVVVTVSSGSRWVVI